MVSRGSFLLLPVVARCCSYVVRHLLLVLVIYGWLSLVVGNSCLSLVVVACCCLFFVAVDS